MGIDNNVTLSGEHLSRILSISTNGVITISNINFIDGNSSGESGGAINLIDGTLIVQNSRFIDNNSSTGGAIRGGNLIIEDSHFENNFVNLSGGAVYVNYLKKAIITNSTFINNIALRQGGAIYGNSDIDNSSFIGNSANWNGGAIRGDGDVNNSTFTKNSSSQNGGAIYGVVNIDNSNFTENNSSQNGGAIYNRGVATIINSQFVNNYAETNNSDYGNGGAIYNEDNLSITSSSFIENNSSQNGGAIYNDDFLSIYDSNSSGNYAPSGGFAYGDNIQIVKSTMKKNRSDNNGGAVYGGHIKIDKSTFIDNISQKYGGAIEGFYMEINNSDFINNSANWFGGAIYGDGVVFNSAFYQNSANFGGGAIGFNGSRNIEVLSSLFLENSSPKSGGAIYARNDTTVQNSIFIRNQSISTIAGYGNGGAIYNSESSTATPTFINNSFIENGASSGGAIYSKIEANTTIYYSLFTKNYSEDNSTIYCEDNTSLLAMFSNYIDLNRVVGEADYNVSNIQPQVGDILLNEDFTIPDNSILIDKGEEVTVDNFVIDDFSTSSDFICNERVVNDKVDIGAIEFNEVKENSCETDKLSKYICADGWYFDLNKTSCVVDLSQMVEVPIHQGWNLIAVDTTISEIPVDISMVWIYRDNSWLGYSPNGLYSQAISDAGINMIDQPITSKDGIWFLSDNDFNFISPKPLSEDNSSEESIQAQNLGWNLMGTSDEVSADNISCQEGNLSLIWKYNSGEWLLYIPNINTSLFDSMFDTLLPNEGFWVQCR